MSEKKTLLEANFCRDSVQGPVPRIEGLWCCYRYLITSIALEKGKKKCDIVYIILVQGFCLLKIKITQFPDGFLLNPLRTKSDKHEISPFNINALDNRLVMRIEYMIKEDKSN